MSDRNVVSTERQKRAFDMLMPLWFWTEAVGDADDEADAILWWCDGSTDDATDPLYPYPMLHRWLRVATGLRADFPAFLEFLDLQRREAKSASYVESDRTIGELSEWILDNGDPPAEPSLNVCGKDCAPAAVFVAIRSIAEQLTGRRIGPSTPVDGTLADEDFEVFRLRTDVATQGRLPRVTGPGCLTVLTSFATIGVASLVSTLSGVAGIALLLALPVVAGLTFRKEAGEENPRRSGWMPDGGRTYGDLARAIAKRSPIPTAYWPAA